MHPLHPTSRSAPTRRRWLTALVCAGGLTATLAATLPTGPAALAAGGPSVDDGTAPTTAAFAALNPVTPLSATTFADPPSNDKPWVRWNFSPTDPTTTTASLQADLQDAADHNIGGVEIGQTGEPTKDQLAAIYAKADQVGITVSLKAANGLPGGQTYAATDPYVRRTLANYRLGPVNAGASVDADVPGPATGPSSIVAVLAYRCSTSPCANLTGGTVTLDKDSVVDLTSTLTGTDTAGYQGASTQGHLTWTAPATPAGSQWLVTVFRAVPFGAAEPETLSKAGTAQVTAAYDTYLGGGLGDLVRKNGGDFFSDSHASDPWGAPEELWSSDMRTQFQQRAGYDIVPLLPALVDSTMAGAGLGGPPAASTVFYAFSDGSGSRIRSDFNAVRSDLYTENRIVPFQSWAHGYNMKLRVQQEDGPITSGGDQLQTSSALDRSEYESLTGSDQTDLYRSMASANHMTGNTWYSTECCAVLNESWAETTEDMIVRMNHQFAGGVNRIVYHTRPSTAISTSTWPGPGYNLSLGKVGFSNSYNGQHPYYTDAAATNDYFARSHEVLTQGAAKVDLAVYLRNWSNPSAFSTTDPNNKHWQDTSLQRAGWTWDYTDESLMDLPNATVRNGRLATDGPSYKALVFDQFLYPTSNTARGSLSVEAARKILSYAQAGLPVIFVGKPNGTGSYPASSDSQLAPVLAQLQAQSTFHQVPTEAAVPAALKRLGLTPAAKPAQPTSVMSVRRRDTTNGTDYYWLYNQGVDAFPGGNGTFGLNPSNLYEDPDVCRTTTVNNPCMATGDDVDTKITLTGRGVPILLDTSSGKITPIAQYTRKGDAVTVPLHLARDDSTVIALTQHPGRFGVRVASKHVVSTTADGVVTKGRNVYVRASHRGRYVTQLGKGQALVTRFTKVPHRIDLTDHTWALDAEDWQPANPYGTTGVAGSETTKPTVSVQLSALKPWPDIPQLQSASGVGTYTTTVKLAKNWKRRTQGAVLDLGQVTDSFRVSINGHDVGIDQISGEADLSRHLHRGKNTLVVRVATTLNNRLYSLDTAVRNRGLVQEYGLVGPVTLTPYRLALVHRGGRHHR